MKRMLIITPYPMKTIELSAYMQGYIHQYNSMGFQIVREKIYFWEHKIGYSLKWLLLLFRLIEPFRAIILHQHTIPSSGPMAVLFLAAARLLRRKTVVVSHETVFTYAKHLPRGLRWIAYLYERLIVRCSWAYVVHTREHFDEISSLVSHQIRKVRVIPHPVPSVRLPLYRERKVWGFYGMIAFKKGVDLLIEAYQQFPAGDLPALRIMGAAAPGENRYETECRGMVRPEYNQWIMFTGFLPETEKPKLFADVALMIFPYRYISQSGALAESCMYGIPFIAADLPFFRDFCMTFGGGRLFAANSSEALRREMAHCAKDAPLLTDIQIETMRNELSTEKCALRFKELIEGEVN